MRVGIALEHLLVDVESAFNLWLTRNQGGAGSYLEPKVVNDESFWATLKPIQKMEIDFIGDIYVLTERPQKLFLPTRSWLRREGIRVKDEHIIMKSAGRLKRYDARLNDLDYFIDCDPDVLESFKYDRCIPIGVGKREDFASWIRVHDTLQFVTFETDLRDWKLLP